MRRRRSPPRRSPRTRGAARARRRTHRRRCASRRPAPRAFRHRRARPARRARRLPRLEALKTVKTDQRAVRPHDRETRRSRTSRASRPRPVRPRRPGEAAVVGMPNGDQPGDRVEVRQVTTAAEGAHRTVVAGEPLLVVRLVRRGGGDDRRPNGRRSRDLLTRSAIPSAASPSVEMSHVLRTASYATTGSLTRSYGPETDAAAEPRSTAPAPPAGARVRGGRPADAAGESYRPDWNAVTIVRPTERLSGSTCVSCCARSKLASRSRESRRVTTSQSTPTTSVRSAVAGRPLEPQRTRSTEPS